MPEIVLKSTIDMKLIDKMGHDQRAVEAMLVSTQGLNSEEAAIGPLTGRLNYIMEHRHGVPWEHCCWTIRVHAPIKVWREWHRHRVGFSYSEQSGRYTPFEPVFWLPPKDRPMIQTEGFKSARPAFDVPTEPEYDTIKEHLRAGYKEAFARYEAMLAIGCDKGLARDVLGVGIFSACYVTMNARSCMHFLELRTRAANAKRKSFPLWEINNAADQLEAIFAEHFPISHEVWVRNGRLVP